MKYGGVSMSIILSARWQYVYWLAVFLVYGFLIKICHVVFQGPEATAIAIITILTCVSAIAVYIDKKIFWGRWNIVHIAGDQWKCLQCDETFQNQIHFMRERHRIKRVCDKRPEDGRLPGCGKLISSCNHQDHTVTTCICNVGYRYCVEAYQKKHENCQRCRPKTCAHGASDQDNNENLSL